MATQIATATAELPVIRAAGGILLRDSPGGDEVMIVFRARHQDWTLPKGKLKDGESFQEAAVREVEEETGCRCRLDDYLGMVSYAHRGIPKVVMFWRMTVLEEKSRPDGDEITEALWLPVPAAIQCLTYAQEKSLLARVVQRPAHSEANESQPAAPLEAAPEHSTQAEVVSIAEVAPSPVLEPEPEPAVEAEPLPAPEAASPAPEPVLVLTPAPTAPGLEREPAAGAPTVTARESAPEASRESDSQTKVATLPLSTTVALAVSPRRRSFLFRRRRDKRSLGHELEVLRVEVAFLARREANSDDWASAAQQHLANVAGCLENNDLEGGRVALRAARRYAALGLGPAELAARAQVLRDEALKMFSWRGPAIQRLLAVSDDKLNAPRISDAMLLRDDDEAEQLRRARKSTMLLRILLLLTIVGALALVLSFSYGILSAFQDHGLLGFLGLIGASVAAAQQIIQRREEGRMPDLLTMLALVVAGVVAGLAAGPIYQSAAHYFKLKHIYDPAIYALAFILGYTAERTLSYFAGFSREHVSVHY